MVSFIFGGNSGIKSPEELEQRRALARQLVVHSATQQPKNAWEGLGAIADAIGYRVERNRLDEAETKQRGAADGRFNALFQPAAYTPADAAAAPGLSGTVAKGDAGGWPNTQPAGDRQPVRLTQAGGPSLSEMLQVYADPWTSPGPKSVLQMYIEREMQASDPIRRQQLEKGQLEIDALKSPKRHI
ncbi:hypothetical protein [Taklimakanibacter albus]|uniref:Uncharacterized protein n=1 Tax=Taklimakanibacter albus TaxID=2800327 RepID=A0ACC5RBS3_9HYPH|nr:hypothetical protein [Aestuariivirga sp. YIM B02566]MBK1870075.1 hypothetical protein [Aestuariivirga sp. YIM B02566]